MKKVWMYGLIIVLSLGFITTVSYLLMSLPAKAYNAPIAATVVVTVKNANTASPISGARVRIYQGEGEGQRGISFNLFKTTDAAGVANFEIGLDSMPARMNRIGVEVTKTGYEKSQSDYDCSNFSYNNELKRFDEPIAVDVMFQSAPRSTGTTLPWTGRGLPPGGGTRMTTTTIRGYGGLTTTTIGGGRGGTTTTLRGSMTTTTIRGYGGLTTTTLGGGGGSKTTTTMGSGGTTTTIGGGGGGTTTTISGGGGGTATTLPPDWGNGNPPSDFRGEPLPAAEYKQIYPANIYIGDQTYNWTLRAGGFPIRMTMSTNGLVYSMPDCGGLEGKTYWFRTRGTKVNKDDIFVDKIIYVRPHRN